jgi:hypothetical protein
VVRFCSDAASPADVCVRSQRAQTLVTTTAQRVSSKAGRTARQARGSRALRWPARAGLVARGLFYLLLASLAIRIASDSAGTRQADPNGALQVVASKPLGVVVLGAAVLGFAAFAIARLVAAVVALTGDKREWWDGARAICEFVAYAAMATLTTTFVFGNRQEGSEQSHHTFTAKLLQASGGRELVVALGLGIIGFYGYQAFTSRSAATSKTVSTSVGCRAGCNARRGSSAVVGSRLGSLRSCRSGSS